MAKIQRIGHDRQAPFFLFLLLLGIKRDTRQKQVQEIFDKKHKLHTFLIRSISLVTRDTLMLTQTPEQPQIPGSAGKICKFREY